MRCKRWRLLNSEVDLQACLEKEMENVIGKSLRCRAGYLINSNRIPASRFEIDGAEFLVIFHCETARILVGLIWVCRSYVLNRVMSPNRVDFVCPLESFSCTVGCLIHSVQTDDSQFEIDGAELLESFPIQIAVGFGSVI